MGQSRREARVRCKMILRGVWRTGSERRVVSLMFILPLLSDCLLFPSLSLTLIPIAM